MMLLRLHAMENVQSLAIIDKLPAAWLSLGRPSFWLTLLVTLVVLSSIRAAVLYMRPLSAGKRGKVSVVHTVVEQSGDSKFDDARKTRAPTPVGSGAVQPRSMSSWLWGMVRWETLPTLPQSQTERVYQPPLSSPPPRRSSVPYPSPYMYQSDVPLSMAKLIMSRHTFRRPASRPPPVRSANTPQYQRRSPSMV